MKENGDRLIFDYGIDIYALLSKAFGQTINSFEDIDTIILQMADGELLKTQLENYSDDLAKKKYIRSTLRGECKSPVRSVFLLISIVLMVLFVSYGLGVIRAGFLVSIGLVTIVGGFYYWYIRAKKIKSNKKRIAELDQEILQLEELIKKASS